MHNYIHVSDLAAAHVLVLEALMADPARSLTFNCGYGRDSVLEALDEPVGAEATISRMEPRRAAAQFADFPIPPG
ncbi:MAG: hypothetical protein ACJLS3_14450 [Erythrobacter sp.]